MRTKAFRHTPLFAALACAFVSPAALAVADPLQVTSAADDGGVTPGTLAYAINYANSNCDAVTGNPAPVITFAIPAGPFVIAPSSGLPQFFCASPNAYNPTIDGSTQSGYVPNTSGGFNSQIIIAVDGSANPSASCGLSMGNNGYGGSLTVRGLGLQNWTYGGFAAAICGSVALYGNRIAGNSYGVVASGSSIIGSAAAADRNVIAGNTFDAIQIQSGISAFSVTNNLIGLDDSAGNIVAAPNQNGIRGFCCGSQPGTIAGNVIVSTFAGIELQEDGGSVITQNIFGGNPSGTSLLGSGSYGIALHYSYGSSIDNNVFIGQDTGIYNDNGGQGPGISITNNRIGTDASGTTALSGGDGIYDQYSNATFISGNLISGHQDSGIYLYSTQNVSITSNKIGTNASGTGAISGYSGYDGIYDQYSYGTAISGNLISGQEDAGVWLSGTQYDSVSGNLIGTDVTGSAALGNYWGVYFGNSGLFNTFDNNTISGNYVGIYFSDASSATVSNSRIGTNASGTAAVPNNYGVWAECGTDLTFSGNMIGGNTNAGMQLSAIQNSLLSNNTVGGAVPNGGAGIELSYLFCGGAQRAQAKAAGGAKSIAFGANNESDGNRIEDSVISNNSGHGLWIVGGNNNTTFDNRINSNMGDGVRIEPHCCDPTYGGPISPAVGNSLVLNDVYGNGGKNVNLGFDGAALANDSMDADSGPNNWQNRPVISSVILDTGKNLTTIAFSLDSKAGDYNIDFYSNPSPGVPAGQNYLGNTVISLAVDGPGSGTYSRAGTSADNISALATRVGPESPAIQDSSEYSDEVAAAALPVPGVSVIPASIDFGDVVVGRSAGPSAVTIGSVGTGDYTISALRDGSCTGPAICSTGSFICSTSCVEASPYRPGTTCSINATFAPTSLGPQSKSLALCDDAAGSPRTITFTGNGVSTPVVDITIAPLFWSFGQVLVGLTSGPQSFTISNLSASQVYLGTARTTGDFTILGGNCGATLVGNSTCSIDAVFAPLASGGVNGTLEVTGSDQPIPAALRAKGAKAAAPTTNTVIARLQGSGVQFGDLRLPATMNFGALLLHSAPGHQSLTLTNTGNGTLTISSISVSGPFTLANGCGSTLAAGASCTVTLDFNPSALGTFNGALTVISDAPGGSRSIALSANVVADARPVVRVSATTMGFGQRIIGSDSPPQRLTITNEGAAVASLTGVTFTQPEASGRSEFSLGGTSCGVTLAPQASCTADVVFRALGFGTRQGELQVPSNSPDSPARVQLGGTGCRPLTPDIIRTGRDPCAP